MSFPALSADPSAVPLASLSAIVLDTETTGLDPASDRIIEIGAVRINAGVLRETGEWSSLVDPGVPIPQSSTAIHGITDGDVAGASNCRDAMAAFVDWAGPAVVIGFSIGFDLAILKSEHERRDIAWQAPRALDVRHLVEIIGPDLPDYALETVAAWLGVAGGDRHRALGDARLTARIFIALLPLLRDRGILTLAQAERAAANLVTQRAAETQAGWESGGDAEDRVVRIDSFLFRHRVRDLMRAPPVVISGDAPLSGVLTRMMSAEISSVFLAPPGDGGPNGIITERDILRAIEKAGPAALDDPAPAHGNYPLVAVPENEFVYRALAEMTGRGFRHLGVTNAAGDLIGALSARDLLRYRTDDASALGNGIDRAESPVALGAVWAGLTKAARALVAEAVDARDIAAIVSRELRALTRRACELALSEMEAGGQGKPPAPFVLLVLGSGGRGESLLAMDQDNAILYANNAPQGADDWFAALGSRVADILAGAGVAYCNGGIMASNAAWRHDFDGWTALVESWVARGKPEDMLNSDIFFDARPVYGDAELFERLRQIAAGKARESRSFLNFLALRAGDISSPLGMFGRFKTDGGRIDLKMHGIMPVFSTARVAALRAGAPVRSTRARLEAVRDHEDVSARAVDNLIEAHGIMLDQILRQQLRDIPRGLALSNRVAPQELSDFDKDRLKWALEQVPEIEGLLGIPSLGR